MNFGRLGPAPGSRMLIVGGCGGIGRALVEAALKIDLHVAVMDLEISRQFAPLPDMVPFFPIDATDEKSLAGAFTDLSRLWDGLTAMINMVGFTEVRVPLAAYETAKWQEVIDGNLLSAFLIAKMALPLLRQNGGGCIVNASSGLAVRVNTGYGPYSVAKAGIVALTKTLALENAPLIRVNAVAPGAVNTSFLRGGLGRDFGKDDKPARFDLAAYEKNIPLGRIAVADDVVGPTLFLCGEASRYLTGQVIYINGGALMP